MSQRIAMAALVLGLAIVGRLAIAADDVPKSSLTLGERPKVSLLPRPPLTEARVRHIKELIASLAKLDKPDYGLSATMDGTNFAPLPGRGQPEQYTVTNHGLQQSTALKELVTIGPDALPFLLEALDNKTPTRIVINRFGQTYQGVKWYDGGMWFGQELQINPVNPAEVGIPEKLMDPNAWEKDIDTYTIKVGDVCFVAIGQIVGRSYKAARYQMTACIVLNSPTNDAILRARVRAIWKSDNPRRKLFDSLCADYATQGVGYGEGVTYRGNEFQTEAALRMLFYFPKETALLLASRLEKLDVAKDVRPDDAARRFEVNGVESGEFVKAVAWASDPAIHAALTDVFNRAGDLNSLLAALPAVEDKELIRKQLTAQTMALPLDDAGPYGDANRLLTALLQRAPDAAKAMFDQYLQHSTADRCQTVCVSLRDAKAPWDVNVLLPMLSDRRAVSWPRLIRVCDEAATTLSQNHSALKFTRVGTYADLDRQIAAMRTALAKRPGP